MSAWPSILYFLSRRTSQLPRGDLLWRSLYCSNYWLWSSIFAVFRVFLNPFEKCVNVCSVCRGALKTVGGGVYLFILFCAGLLGACAGLLGASVFRLVKRCSEHGWWLCRNEMFFIFTVLPIPRDVQSNMMICLIVSEHSIVSNRLLFFLFFF